VNESKGPQDVDLRALVAKGKMFAWLSTPECFSAAGIDPFGHSVAWVDDKGYVIDLSAGLLRRDAERRREIRRLTVD